ncbi:hypothetical protein Ae201684P_004222 [Aphanomyces euteiches]|uniref:MATE efflux family protein n=1 Tax=Aphanomyces euteiches TaxID=100861 RepID=A0A6G0WKM4_9STRA|nr:hypothetical protein Ae201684_014251 [Aphanomyces euteiches]KAH9068515.1 hypothetical protein Ae201684P_004222 [Aphanomyces euteiches]KAH9153563.1 hypothetical protein AeRB84_004218 [Aphanomyces euteiches]
MVAFEAERTSERSPLATASPCVDQMSLLPLKHETPTSIAKELPQLLSLSIPVMFTMVMETLPSMSSIALVGQMQSENVQVYVDAVAISSMYFNITSMAVVSGLATALDTLCTQAFGAGNTTKFGVYLQSALLGLLIALVPVTLLNVFSGHILVFLGQDPVIASHAQSFLFFSSLGLPGFCIYNILKKMLQAHNVVQPMAIISILGNVIHLSLGYYLTYYTSVGLIGPAISRAIAYTGMTLLMFLYLAWNPLYKTWELRWSWAAATSHLGQFFKYGVPGMLMMMTEWAAFEILTLFSGLMDDHVVVIGVNSILMNMLSFVYMPFSGNGIAVNIRIGNLLGAYKPESAKVVMQAGFVMAAGMITVVASLLALGRHVIPQVFIHDPVVVERTSTAILCIILLQMSDAFNANCQGVLRATGQQDIGTYVNTAAYYIVGIPMACLWGFSWHGSVEGLWLGFTTGSLLALSVFAWILSRLDWKKLAKQAVARVQE